MFIGEVRRTKEFYSSVVGGHPGVQATTKRFTTYFCWKGLRNMVKEWIWQDLSMDFIESLLMTHGKSALLVVVDRLSKYAHVLPITHPYTALQVAQLFLDNVYKLHGLPKTIVSDRDKFHLCTFLMRPKIVRWKNVDRLCRHGGNYLVPFQVVKKIGKVVYKLKLPDYAKVHHVFHVSQLKPCYIDSATMGSFPLCDKEGLLAATPLKLLDRRMVKQNNRMVVFGLVQWSNGSEEANHLGKVGRPTSKVS
ncbi:reverse transcriptase [Tanacetum coccineum]